jgi:amino acid permease
MDYLIISSIISFAIGGILTASIPSSENKNIENSDNANYKPYNIKAMEIFSYIFYAIGGILILPEIISYFKK